MLPLWEFFQFLVLVISRRIISLNGKPRLWHFFQHLDPRLPLGTHLDPGSLPRILSIVDPLGSPWGKGSQTSQIHDVKLYMFLHDPNYCAPHGRSFHGGGLRSPPRRCAAASPMPALPGRWSKDCSPRSSLPPRSGSRSGSGSSAVLTRALTRHASSSSTSTRALLFFSPRCPNHAD